VSRSLGIHIDDGFCRALAPVRSGYWIASAPYESDEDLLAVLRSLVSDRPPRIRRVQVVLGTTMSQCKLTDDVPRMRDAELLGHVRVEQRRYFLREPGPMTFAARRITSSRRTSGSCLLAGANESTLEATWEALEAAGLQVQVMAPSLAWTSPDLRHCLDELHELPDQGVAFLQAYRASVGVPLLSLKPVSRESRDRERERRSVIHFGLACAVSAALWGAGLDWRLRSDERRATAELAALGPVVRRAAVLRGERDATRRALSSISAELRLPNQTARLASLTAALPDSAFVSVVRSSVTSWEVVLFARQADEAVRRVSRVGGVASATIDGPVTREQLAGTEWDRFAVRINWGRE